MLNLQSLDDSPYWIHSPNDIRHILKALFKKREPIFLKINEHDSFLSIILQITDHEIIVDASQNVQTNHHIQEYTIQAHGLLDKISIDFYLENGKEILFDGNTAFSFPIPQKIHELQRRKFYRLHTPIINPLLCSITFQKNQQQPKIYQSTIFDISLLGICIEKINSLAMQEKEIYENCFIIFPNKKIARFSISVKRIFSVEIKSGIVSHRIGCAFEKITPADEQIIQSYMIQAEREKIFALKHLA
jgi:c-di-GMP-binding flagellar brake protein YcgR